MFIKKISLSLCFLCFSVTLTYAQSDYIITSKKDTLWGTIKDYGRNKVKYQQTGSSDKIKYTPLEVDFFHIEGSSLKEYKSVKTGKEGNRVFLPVIENGELMLLEGVEDGTYFYSSNKQVPGPRIRIWYALKRGSDNIFEIKNNVILIEGEKKQKGDFRLLIEDNASLLNKFETDDKFSYKQIRNLIKQYNLDALAKKQKI